MFKEIIRKHSFLNIYKKLYETNLLIIFSDTSFKIMF